MLPKEPLDDDDEAGLPDAELAVSPAKTAADSPAPPLKSALAAKRAVPSLDLGHTGSRELLITAAHTSSSPLGPGGGGSSSPEASARSQRSGFLVDQRLDRQAASRANSWASQASPPRSARGPEQT